MKGKEMKAVVSIGGKVDASLNKSIQSAVTSTKGMSAAMSASFAQAGKDIAKLDTVFGGIEKAAKTALSTIAVGAAGVTAGIAASIKVGSAFESQMSTVEAISGASASEMERLSDAALELGSTTQFTASEVGSAMEYMGMAGWKAEDMLSGIDGVINLAAASGEDLATVSDILTDDLTAFGLSAEDASRMVDVMAATATNANTNVSMMGETFKYAAPIANTLGFSLEEVAVATGLMANSGIKASQAGTSLRTWMSNMAAPTKQTAQAMDELGISITNDEGDMKSFAEIIEETRSAMRGMSEDEQARYAKLIAGKNAMSGMLAVINATEEDTRKLTEAIENSAGAAEKMAEIRMDNLEGDVTKFKSALEGLGVSIYQEIKDPAREAVQGLTGEVDSLKEKLPGAIADVVKKFPNFLKGAKKFLQPVFDLVKNGVKWVIDHKKGVIGVIAGIGAALVSYKIARKVMDITSALKGLQGGLGPVGIAIGGVTTAIGAVTTAIAIYEQHLAELKDQSLADHFGNIELSAREIEDVINFLTGSEGITKIKTAMQELGDLNTIGDSIDETIRKLNKYNWMISIGMELNEDQEADFRSSVESYITETNEYLTQDQYAVMLNLKANLSDVALNESGLLDTMEDFYTNSGEQLSALGKKLNDAITEGFADGFLDFDETQTIAELEAKMERVRQGLAANEANKALKVLQLDAMDLGGNLDPESFMNLMDQASEKVRELNDLAKESYVSATEETQALMQFEIQQASHVATSVDDYQRRKQEILDRYLGEGGLLYEENLNYLNQKTENSLKSFEFGIGTLMTSTYEEELNAAVEPMNNLIKEFMDTAMNPEWLTSEGLLVDGELQTSGARTVQTMVDNLQAEVTHLIDDPGTKGALKELLETMAPQEAEMEQLAQEYLEAGQEVPKSIAEGITSFNMMEALAGDEGSLWTVIGSQLESDGSYDVLKQAMNDNGTALPEEVKNGIEDNISVVTPGIKSLYEAVQTQATALFSQGISVTVPFDIQYSTSGSSISSGRGGMPSSVLRYADGGFTSGPSIAGEDGQEAVISFKSTVRERNVEIWRKAGDILGATTSKNSPAGTSDTITKNGGNTITFAPNITINGNTDKDTVIDALRKSLSELKDMLAEIGVVTEDEAGYAYG